LSPAATGSAPAVAAASDGEPLLRRNPGVKKGAAEQVVAAIGRELAASWRRPWRDGGRPTPDPGGVL
jgi:hypothetical protein